MYQWQCDNNVKGVARGDEPTENYQLNLPIPSALRSFGALAVCSAVWPMTSLFWLTHHCHSVVFGRNRQQFSAKKLS